MTPLQWQSTFWSIFLSSSRLHGLIPSFFTHFMRLFSFLTVCSCFLKPPFYSVVTIFCNFFFLLVYFSLYAVLSSVTRIILKNLCVIQKIQIKRFPCYFIFLLSVFYQFSMIFAQYHSYFNQFVFNINTILSSFFFTHSPKLSSLLPYGYVLLFLLSSSYSLLLILLYSWQLANNNGPL